MPTTKEVEYFQKQIADYDPLFLRSLKPKFLEQVLTFIELFERNFEKNGGSFHRVDNITYLIVDNVMQILHNIDPRKHQISCQEFPLNVLAALVLSLKTHYGVDHPCREKEHSKLKEFFVKNNFSYQQDETVYYERQIFCAIDFSIPDLGMPTLPLVELQRAYLARIKIYAENIKKSFSKEAHEISERMLNTIEGLKKYKFSSVEEMLKFKINKYTLLDCIAVKISDKESKKEKEIHATLEQLAKEYSHAYTPACKAKASKIIGVINKLRSSGKTFDSLEELFAFNVNQKGEPPSSLQAALDMPIADENAAIEEKIKLFLAGELETAEVLAAQDCSMTKWQVKKTKLIKKIILKLQNSSMGFESLDEILQHYDAEEKITLKQALELPKSKLEVDLEYYIETQRKYARADMLADHSFSKWFRTRVEQLDLAIQRINLSAQNPLMSFDSVEDVAHYRYRAQYSIMEIVLSCSLVEKDIESYLLQTKEFIQQERSCDNSFTQWRRERAQMIDSAIQRVVLASRRGMAFADLNALVTFKDGNYPSIQEACSIQVPRAEQEIEERIGLLEQQAYRDLQHDNSYTKWKSACATRILNTIEKIKLDLLNQKIVFFNYSEIYHYASSDGSLSIYEICQTSTPPLEDEIEKYLKTIERKAISMQALDDEFLTKNNRIKSNNILRAIANIRNTSLPISSLEFVNKYSAGRDLSLEQALIGSNKSAKEIATLEDILQGHLRKIEEQIKLDRRQDRSWSKWQTERADKIEQAIKRVRQSKVAFTSIDMLNNHRAGGISIGEALAITKPALEVELERYVAEAGKAAAAYVDSTALFNFNNGSKFVAISKAIDNLKSSKQAFKSLTSIASYKKDNDLSLHGALSLSRMLGKSKLGDEIIEKARQDPGQKSSIELTCAITK